MLRSGLSALSTCYYPEQPLPMTILSRRHAHFTNNKYNPQIVPVIFKLCNYTEFRKRFSAFSHLLSPLITFWFLGGILENIFKILLRLSFCVCVWVQEHEWMQVPVEAKRCPEDELSGSCEPPNTVHGNQAWVFWESSKSAWLQSHLVFPLGASFEDTASELHSSVGGQDLIKKKCSLHWDSRLQTR